MTIIRNRAEWAPSEQRVTVLLIVGVLFIPLIVVGILLAAAGVPTDRLGTVSAAIVNNDESVERDGETVLLGRQFAAELVGLDTNVNYDWVITDSDDAGSGLADGRYAAVVTIPKNFSDAATSFGGEPENAEPANVDVLTSTRSTLTEEMLSRSITTAASAALGRQLTTSYLDGIYIGFNTLNDQLGQAADGADELDSGVRSLSDASRELADGIGALSLGATDLSTGAQQLGSGTAQLADGLAELDAGATGNGGTNPGLAAGAAGVATGAAGITAGVQQTKAAVDQQGTALIALAERCDPTLAGAAFCQELATSAYTVAGIGSGAPGAGGGMTDLAAGAGQVSDGAARFSAGIPLFTGGLARLSGASTQLAGGASDLSGGTADLAGGIADLADGATQLADGTTALSDGSRSLADGIQTAVDSLPTYSSAGRGNLAQVVAEPVSASGSPLSSGTNGSPILAVLAIWLGALASLLVLRAVPTVSFGSTRSSIRLALRAFAPVGVIGAAAGLLVSGALAPLLDLDPGAALIFAGVAALTGAAFAAANQALVAILGGVGRLLSAVVALIALGAGIAVSIPPILEQVMAFLPLGPAINGLRSVPLGEAGAGAAVGGLLLWLAACLLITTSAVARRRTVSVRGLRRAITI